MLYYTKNVGEAQVAITYASPGWLDTETPNCSSR
jgi:hypothetical protein